MTRNSPEGLARAFADMRAITVPLHRRSEVNAAQGAASAFFRLAGQFFSKLPKDINQSAKYCYDNRSDFIAACTNLALSTELSLKALAMATGGKALRTHNLLELFDTIPERNRKSLELVFNRRLQLTPKDQVRGTLIYITSTPQPPTDTEMKNARNQYPEVTDLRSLLKAEKDAFKNWRYFHEAGSPAQITLMKIEYGQLAVLNNSLLQMLGVMI